MLAAPAKRKRATVESVPKRKRTRVEFVPKRKRTQAESVRTLEETEAAWWAKQLGPRTPEQRPPLPKPPVQRHEALALRLTASPHADARPGGKARLDPDDANHAGLTDSETGEPARARLLHTTNGLRGRRVWDYLHNPEVLLYALAVVATVFVGWLVATAG
jgi:hypothetical protein